MECMWLEEANNSLLDQVTWQQQAKFCVLYEQESEQLTQIIIVHFLFTNKKKRYASLIRYALSTFVRRQCSTFSSIWDIMTITTSFTCTQQKKIFIFFDYVYTHTHMKWSSNSFSLSLSFSPCSVVVMLPQATKICVFHGHRKVAEGK